MSDLIYHVGGARRHCLQGVGEWRCAPVGNIVFVSISSQTKFNTIFGWPLPKRWVKNKTLQPTSMQTKLLDAQIRKGRASCTNHGNIKNRWVQSLESSPSLFLDPSHSRFYFRVLCATHHTTSAHDCMYYNVRGRSGSMYWAGDSGGGCFHRVSSAS